MVLITNKVGLEEAQRLILKALAILLLVQVEVTVVVVGRIALIFSTQVLAVVRIMEDTLNLMHPIRGLEMVKSCLAGHRVRACSL